MHTIRKVGSRYIVGFVSGATNDNPVPMFECDSLYIAMQLCSIINGFRLQDESQLDALMHQGAREIFPTVSGS